MKEIRKINDPIKLSLDFMGFDGYLMGAKYLWDELATELLSGCDEKGDFTLSKSLRKKILSERKDTIPRHSFNVRQTDRKLKVEIICYKPDQRDEPHYFTPKEYVTLGRPNELELEVTRAYRVSKKS